MPILFLCLYHVFFIVSELFQNQKSSKWGGIDLFALPILNVSQEETTLENSIMCQKGCCIHVEIKLCT